MNKDIERCGTCGAVIALVGYIHLCRPRPQAIPQPKQAAAKAKLSTPPLSTDSESVHKALDVHTVPVATKAKPRDAAYWREMKRARRAMLKAGQTVNKP